MSESSERARYVAEQVAHQLTDSDYRLIRWPTVAAELGG